MQRREFMLIAIAILGAATVGSIAYTSASVDRSITSNIAPDDVAIIGLSAGEPAAVTQNSDGQLVIDTAEGDSSGINSGGSFTYGDSENPATTHAFSIANNDEIAHNLTVSLRNLDLPGNASFTVSLYDSNGDSLGDVTPSNDVTQNNWSTEEELFAILTVETNGTTSSDSLSGTLHFDAVSAA